MTTHPSRLRTAMTQPGGTFRRFFAALAIIFLACVPSPRATAADAPLATPDFTLAISATDLDLDACISMAGDKEIGKATEEVLTTVLGLNPAGKRDASWSTGAVAPQIRRFRLAFKQPVQVGTIVSEWADRIATIDTLKADAPYPGDMMDDSQWQPLTNRWVRTLPANTSIRALRYTFTYSNLPWDNPRTATTFPATVFLKARFYSPLAFGRNGRGEVKWSTTDRKPNVLDTAVAFWPVDQPMAGIVLLAGPPSPVALARLEAPPEMHPLKATAAMWQAFPQVKAAAGPLVIELPGGPAKPTRALKLDVLNYLGRNRAPVIVPLVALGADEQEPESFDTPSPFAFNYEMPINGFIALRIADANGNEVRRLVAEETRRAGPVREAWDLENDAGRAVPPGTYTWRAIVRPPLKLTYENTVYNAGSPPWQAPVAGGGWWMADHSPPIAVGTMPGHVFIAALGAEFGHGLIATDLDGNKQWGDGHLGAENLVGDARYMYAVRESGVTRIDLDHGSGVTPVYSFKYSEASPSPGSGAWGSQNIKSATYGGKLYVTMNAPATPWIKSAFTAGQIDQKRTFPPIFAENTHETAYGPLERIAGAFLAITSSQQAYFGDTSAQGKTANTLILRLNHAVPVGSVMLPDQNIEVYALREGKKLPAMFDQGAESVDGAADLLGGGDLPDLGALGELDNRFPPDLFVRLTPPSAKGPGIAVPPAGLRTSVLIFTSSNLKRIPYGMVLDRRYRDASSDAKVVPVEGKNVGRDGWFMERPPDNPISPGNPPMAALVWDKPTEMRGFALMEPLGWSGYTVDYWTGADDATIGPDEIRDDTNWKTVYTHHQERASMKMNWHTDTVLWGDFGTTLVNRALRVRIIDPPGGCMPPGFQARGGFKHIVVFQSLGGDVDLPLDMSQRLVTIDLPETPTRATTVKEAALRGAGALAFTPDGVLYAVGQEGILRVTDPAANPVVGELVIPRKAYSRSSGMVIDDRNRLYLLDGGIQAIRVFDLATNTQVATIGTPGGAQLGPLDPTRFTNVTNLALDANGKLWVVDLDFQPKRVSRWSREGVLEKEFYGPTHYGGGGHMDAGDRSVVIYYGMKFRVDWTTKDWKFESRLYRPGYGLFASSFPDRPMYFKGKRYLVGDTDQTLFGSDAILPVICAEVDGIAKPMAAAGVLARWNIVNRRKDLRDAFKAYQPDTTGFVWSDLNRDNDVQLDEIQVQANLNMSSIFHVGDDLSFNFAKLRLRPTEVRADGLPIYDLSKIIPTPELTNDGLTTVDGDTFVMGYGFVDRNGVRQWDYPDRYMGVQGSAGSPGGMGGRAPGMLAGGLRPTGQFVVGGEQLFSVIGNHGDWYTFTRDGLMVGCIFGGPRGYGRRYFSMPEWNKGKTDLSDLRTTVEDFYGNVVTADDGKVYAIAGKNHVSIVRVEGFEQMQRLGGTFTVTQDDLNATNVWNAKAAAVAQSLLEPRVADIAYLDPAPVIDGETNVDWSKIRKLVLREQFNIKGEAVDEWTAAFAFDKTNLYVTGHAYDESPMVNRPPSPDRPFQGGDGLDIALGLDPAANPDRKEPVAGDVRIVVSATPGTAPTALLYRYVAPGAAVDAAHEFTSPTGTITVPEVKVLSDAKIVLNRKERGWTIEMAIPWSALGVEPPGKPMTLRGDIGFLLSDPNGVTTYNRFYWANRTHIVMGDLPSEARIHPNLWGTLNVGDPNVIRGDILDLDSGSASDELLKGM